MVIPFDTRMRYGLTDLKLVVAIAQAGSVSHGGALCCLSASAASLRLKQLEESVGAGLFVRGPRGVTLTRAGQVMLEYAQRCLADLQQMQVDLVPYTEGLIGQITLYSNDAVSPALMQDIAPFLRAHPRVRIVLEERLSSEIVTALVEGRIDIGIVSGYDAHPQLHFSAYREEALVAIAPPGFEGWGSTVSFNDLWSQPFVSLRAGSAVHGFLAMRASSLGSGLDVRMAVADFATVIGLVRAGVGISVVPRAQLSVEASASLVVRTIDEAWAVRKWMVGAQRDESMLSGYARQLLASLRRKP